MRNSMVGCVWVLLALAAGCGPKESSEPPPPAAEAEWVVAEFSGGKITAMDVLHEEDFWNAGNLRMPKLSAMTPPESATDLIRFIACRDHFAGIARAEGLDREPEFVDSVQTAREDSLATLYQSEQQSTVTEEDARRHYEANLERFTTAESWEFRNIFVQCDKNDPADMERARERAAKALAEVRAGTDFAAAERAWSTRREEELGQEYRVTPGADINPAILEFLEAAKPQEISDVLEVRHGFMVVQLLEHKPAVTRPFEEVGETCVHRAAIAALEAKLEAEAARRGIRIREDRLFDLERSATDVLAEGTDFVVLAGDVERLPPAGPALNQATRDYMVERVQQTINRRLMVELARAEGLESDERLIKHLDLYAKRVLSVMAMDRQMAAQQDRIEVSEEELRREYEADSSLVMRPEQTRIRVINIPFGKTADMAPDEEHFAEERAREQCEQLYARIRNGEDFAALAREYSTGYNSEDGGLLPFEQDGPRGHSIDMAVDQLEIGEVSLPVWHSRGYFLLKLEAVKPPERKPFEEVRELLTNHLRWKRKMELRDEMLQQVADGLNLVIYPSPLTP